MSETLKKITRRIDRLSREELFDVQEIIDARLHGDGHTAGERREIEGVLLRETDDDPERESDASTPKFWAKFRKDGGEIIRGAQGHA